MVMFIMRSDAKKDVLFNTVCGSRVGNAVLKFRLLAFESRSRKFGSISLSIDVYSGMCAVWSRDSFMTSMLTC